MTNLMHKFFYYSYYNPLHVHVSSNILLILRRSDCINLLKPTGYVMHHQFNIQQLYALPTLYLCVLY